MKINCDEEGNKALLQLCDIALKSGGIQNLQGITQILNAIKIEEKKEE